MGSVGGRAGCPDGRVTPHSPRAVPALLAETEQSIAVSRGAEIVLRVLAFSVRIEKTVGLAMLTSLSTEELIPPDHPIRVVADAVLAELDDTFDAMYRLGRVVAADEIERWLFQP